MSWDLFAQGFPDVASVAKIPVDFRPSPLGDPATLIAKIKTVFADSDFSDPSWGIIDHDDWSVEINLGDDAVCNDFALHVRGGGDGAMAAVAAILDVTRCRAIDAQTGEFFELEAGNTSFKQWQAYRDQTSTTAEPAKQVKQGFVSRLFD